jgi:AcrR family transcriptional regulator
VLEDAPKAEAWRRYEPLSLTPILAAALEVFDERGFHGASIRAIASRVGQTLPTLYYHHGSKEGVFVALCDIAMDDLTWRVEAAATAADAPTALGRVIEAIVWHMTYRADIATLDAEVRHLSAASRGRYARQRKVVEKILNDVVQLGLRDAVFQPDDPIVTARALLGMCQAIGHWYRRGGALTPQQVAEQYVAIALRSVGSA